MKSTDILIDGKKYSLIDLKVIDNKNYIAYENDTEIYIGEYIFENNNFKIKPISENLLNIMIKEFNL